MQNSRSGAIVSPTNALEDEELARLADAIPAPDSIAEVVQFGAAAESSVVHRITNCVRFAVPTGRMAAHQRSDRLRDDLYAGGLRKRVVD
jgi:hypothetical protein